MSSKSLPAALPLAPNLFYKARRLELLAIAERVAAHFGRSKFHSLSDCASPVFHLSAASNGCWVIRDEKGTKAGVFRTRQAAIKYARDESPDGNFVIVDDLGGAD